MEYSGHASQLCLKFGNYLYQNLYITRIFVARWRTMRNKCLRHFLCKIRIYFHKYKSIYQHAVEPRYLELAYFELPLISKWKSGPCFNMKLWQPVTKYCGKEEKLLLRSNFSSFPHYFIYKFLTSGVKLHIQLLNVLFNLLFSSLSQLWYLEVIQWVLWNSR